jgi:hypothetical protein
LAFIVFGTLSKISLSIRSCFTGSGATGFSQQRAEQKAIFQPTRMGNIRRSLTRSKCSTRFDWSRGPLEIHHPDQKNTEISQTTTESIPY